MKNFLVGIWPLAAILLAVAIFFYPVWLQGKIPLPADLIVGTYYPWLDYKWGGYVVGVPVKNPITTDVVSFIFPIQMFTMDLIKSGELPLWNNLIVAGTPLLANLQSAPFSPTNFFYFFLPKLLAWTTQIMVQPLLAAIFLYLLLRNFGLGKLPSVAGGVFYGFAGFSTIWMQWNGHSLVAALFPLIFLLSLKWLQNSNIIWGILLSFSLALQIFSGYPQIILYEILGIFILGLVNFRLKKILGLGFFLIMGFGLSAIQIIPALELLKYSQRSVEDVLNVSAFLPWQYLITFFAPDYFGNHATGNFWGEGDYTLVTGFSGVVVGILAFVGILTRFTNQYVKLALSFVTLSLAIALPNPVSIFLKESNFLGLQAASAHRALVLSNLGFAILAAFGLESLRTGQFNRKEIIRAFYIPGILLASFVAGTSIVLFWLKINPDGLEKNITNLNVGLKNLILPLAFMFITGVLIFMRIRVKKFRELFLIVLVALGMIELFRFGWKFTPFSLKEFVFPETPVLAFLQSQKKPFRVAAEDVVPINMMVPYGIETVEGYDAVYPLYFAKYLATQNSNQSDATPMGRYGSVNNVNSKLFNLVNGKYVLSLKRDKEGKPDPAGEIPEKFKQSNLKAVFEDKTVVVLENTLAYPRAFFVSDWVSMKDEKQTLDLMLSDSFPPDRKIAIDGEFGEITTYDNVSRVELIAYKNSSISLDVQTEKAGFLFISQNFYPGWKVYVDGIPEKIYRADYAFQAVPVSAGHHTVNWYYQPESFKFGAMISLISLGILGMMFSIKYAKK